MHCTRVCHPLSTTLEPGNYKILHTSCQCFFSCLLLAAPNPEKEDKFFYEILFSRSDNTVCPPRKRNMQNDLKGKFIFRMCWNTSHFGFFSHTRTKKASELYLNMYWYRKFSLRLSTAGGKRKKKTRMRKWKVCSEIEESLSAISCVQHCTDGNIRRRVEAKCTLYHFHDICTVLTLL